MYWFCRASAVIAGALDNPDVREKRQKDRENAPGESNWGVSTFGIL